MKPLSVKVCCHKSAVDQKNILTRYTLTEILIVCSSSIYMKQVYEADIYPA